MFRSVVLPEPDGPTSPVNSPVFSVRSTPFKAVKKAFPMGKRFIKFFMVMTALLSIISILNNYI